MNNKMPVSALQELMAARAHPLPRYQEEGFDGSCGLFKCTVHVEEITAVGYGSTKKSAKHDCADKALKQLQLRGRENVPKEVVERPLQNYIGQLNEYSSQNCLRYPIYDFVTVQVGGQFVFKCTFGNKEAQGVGMNKKDAKQNAAKNILELIRSGNNDIIKNKCEDVYQKSALDNVDTDRIIQMFKELSFNKACQNQEKCYQSNTSLDSSTNSVQDENEEVIVKLENDNSVEALEKKLKELKVEFTLKDFQKNPYIIVLVVKDTNITLFGTGNTKEEALVKLYNDLIIFKKTIGCSNANLFSFS